MTEVIDCMDINSPKASNIMVIGVGGGGGNAVKYMYDIGVHNVSFMVCNTDAQALKRSPIPMQIQLGNKLTGGLGAGNKPEKGRDAALESAEEIKQVLTDTGVRMVFVTAGMGGGTGTGAAPVIAQIAKEMGILTVGIVTIPFRIEGPKRLNQAEKGLEEIKQHVDSLLVIDNENICKMYGDLDFSDAFGKADDILAIAAKGIAEAVTKEHKVNVDFADVQTTMSNSGIALLGYASTTIGTENVAIELTERALLSPLLNQNNIHGAQDILINISWNNAELKMGELHAIIGHVQAAAGSNANIIWGAGFDESLEENEVSVIIIATGFKNTARIELGDNITTNNFSANSSELSSEKTEDAEVSNEPLERETVSLEEFDEIPNEEDEDIVNDSDDDDLQINIVDNNDIIAQELDIEPEIEQLPLETEYISLDEEQTTQSLEEELKAEDGDEELALSVKDELENNVEDIEEPKIEVNTKTLFDDLEDVDTQENKDLHKNPTQTIQSDREYTIDELENMPAYARRKAMLNVNNSPTTKKLKVEL